MATLNLYRVEVTHANVSYGELQEVPGSRLNDVDVVQLSAPDLTLETEAGQFKIGNMTVQARGMAPDYFSEANDPLETPYVAELIGDDGQIVFWGVVEQGRYNRKTRRTSFIALSPEFMLKRAPKLQPRTVYEGDAQRWAVNESSSQLNVWVHEATPAQVGDVLVLDLPNGEYRAPLLKVGQPEGNLRKLTVAYDVELAALFSIPAAEVGDLPAQGTYTPTWFSRLDIPADVGAELMALFSDDLYEWDNGLGHSVDLRGQGYVFRFVDADDNVIAESTFAIGIAWAYEYEPAAHVFVHNTAITAVHEAGGFDHFELVRLASESNSEEDGRSNTTGFEVLGRSMYGYAPATSTDLYDVETLMNALLTVGFGNDGTGITDGANADEGRPLGIFPWLINGAVAVRDDANVGSTWIGTTLSDKPLEALRELQMVGKSLIRFEPTLVNGLPRVNVEIIPRTTINGSVTPEAIAEVISWEEDEAPRRLEGVVVKPNDDYFAPEGEGSYVGFWFETKDGRVPNHLPGDDGTAPTLSAAERAIKSAPSGDGVIEIKVPVIPSFTGTWYGGQKVLNDNLLAHIARFYYNWFKSAARGVTGTIRQKRPDVLGKLVSVQEGEGVHYFEQTVLVTKVMMDPKGTKTQFEGYILPEYTPPADTPPVAIIGGQRVYTDAGSDGTEEILLHAYDSYSPDGDDLSYTWTVNGTATYTGATLEVSLPMGQHNVQLQVTETNSGLTAYDQVVVTVATPAGEGEDPTDIRGYNAEQFEQGNVGFVRLYPNAPSRVESVKWRRVTGEELPQIDWDQNADPNYWYTLGPLSPSDMAQNANGHYFLFDVPLDEQHLSYIEAYITFYGGLQPVVARFGIDADSKADFSATNIAVNTAGQVFLTVQGDSDTRATDGIKVYKVVQASSANPPGPGDFPASPQYTFDNPALQVPVHSDLDSGQAIYVKVELINRSDGQVGATTYLSTSNQTVGGTVELDYLTLDNKERSDFAGPLPDGLVMFDAEGPTAGLNMVRASGWYQVWDSGNDGQGSGLDADLVRGFYVGQDLRPTDTVEFQGVTLTDGGRFVGEGGDVVLRRADGTNHGTLVLENLVVLGSVDQQSTNILEVEDQFIKVNRGATGTPNLHGGMQVERGDQPDAVFEWDEGNDRWAVSGAQYGDDVWAVGIANGQRQVNLNADLWDGAQFSDYLNQGVRTGDSPTFAALVVSGLLTAAQATITGAVDVGGTLDVDGRLTANLGLTANDDSTFNGNVDVYGEIDVRTASDNPLRLRSTDTGGASGTAEGGFNYIAFYDAQNDRQAWTGIGSNGDYYIRPEIADARVRLDGDAYVTGLLETSSGIYDRGAGEPFVYKHVARFHQAASGTVGYLKIKLPRGASLTMMHLRVDGYDYDDLTGAWSVIAGVYNYTSGYVNPSATVVGSAPFYRVAWGRIGTDDYLVLGLEGNVWNHPNVVVSHLQTSYLDPEGWQEGWSFSFGNDDAEFDDLEVMPVGLRTYGGRDFVRVGIGKATPGHELDVEGTGRFTDDVRVGDRLYLDSSSPRIETTNYLGFNNEGGGAQTIKVGGLVVSNTFGDAAPTNGIFVVGQSILRDLVTADKGLNVNNRDGASPFVVARTGSTYDNQEFSVSLTDNDAYLHYLNDEAVSAITFRIEDLNGTRGLRLSSDAADLALSTTDYISGPFGVGFTLEAYNASGSYFEIDNVRVRGELRTHIFRYDEVRATNGYLYIADATEVSQDVVVPTDGEQTITVKDPVFDAGDLLWYKSYDLDSGGGTVVTSVKVQVKTEAGANVATPVTQNGITRYLYDVKSTLGGSGGTMQAGGTIVRVGNIENPDRDAALYFDASSEKSPFFDVYDGVTSWAEFHAAAKLKMRIGHLSGAYNLADGDYGMAAGQPDGSHIIAKQDGVFIRENTDEWFRLEGGTMTLGTTTSGQWVTIRDDGMRVTAGATLRAYFGDYVALYDTDGKDRLVATTGSVKLGDQTSGTYVSITDSSQEFYKAGLGSVLSLSSAIRVGTATGSRIMLGTTDTGAGVNVTTTFVRVGRETDSHVKLTGVGMEVLSANAANSLGYFGDHVRVGETTGAHAYLDQGVFYLRGADGTAGVTVTADGTVSLRGTGADLSWFSEYPEAFYPLSNTGLDAITGRLTALYGSASFTPRVGRFLGGALSVSSASTNIVNSASGASGILAIGSAFNDKGNPPVVTANEIIEAQTPFGARDVAHVAWDYAAGDGGGIQMVATPSTPIVEGATYTFSYFLKLSDWSNLSSNLLYLTWAGASSLGGQYSIDREVDYGGGWKRIYCTATAPAGATAVYMRAYLYDQNEVWAFGAQIEALPYLTQYHEGRIGGGEFEIPFSPSPREGTFAVWITNYGQRDLAYGTSVLSFGGGNGSRNDVWLAATDEFVWICEGAGDSSVRPAYVHEDNTPYLFVLTWDADAGERVFRVYDPKNDAWTEDTGRYGTGATWLDHIKAGLSNGYSSHTRYEQMVHLPYAMTYGEAKALAAMTTPISPNVNASYLDANKLVTGRLEARDGSTWIDLDSGRFDFRGRFTHDGTTTTIADWQVLTGSIRSQNGVMDLDSQYGNIRVDNNAGLVTMMGRLFEDSGWMDEYGFGVADNSQQTFEWIVRLTDLETTISGWTLTPDVIYNSVGLYHVGLAAPGYAGNVAFFAGASGVTPATLSNAVTKIEADGKFTFGGANGITFDLDQVRLGSNVSITWDALGGAKLGFEATINSQTYGGGQGSGVGEIYLNAIDIEGDSVDDYGAIQWNGNTYRLTVRNLLDKSNTDRTLYTGASNATEGFAVLDTTYSRKFAGYQGDVNIVFVRYNAGQWQYDNNSTWVNFTPAATDVAFGAMMASLDNVQWFKPLAHPVSITAAPFAPQQTQIDASTILAPTIIGGEIYRGAGLYNDPDTPFYTAGYGENAKFSLADKLRFYYDAQGGVVGKGTGLVSDDWILEIDGSGTFSGIITATGGEIGGWTLSSTYLQNTSGSDRIRLSASQNEIQILHNYGSGFIPTVLMTPGFDFTRTAETYGTAVNLNVQAEVGASSIGSGNSITTSDTGLSGDETYLLHFDFEYVSQESTNNQFTNWDLSVFFYNGSSWELFYSGYEGDDPVYYRPDLWNRRFTHDGTVDSVDLLTVYLPAGYSGIRVEHTLTFSTFNSSYYTQAQFLHTWQKIATRTELNHSGLLVTQTPSQYVEISRGRTEIVGQTVVMEEATLDLSKYTGVELAKTGQYNQATRFRGNMKVEGAFSVAGSKSFAINHPDPAKAFKQTLWHSAVESPTRGDNLYRYTVEVGESGSTDLSLPSYFRYLNENPQAWVARADGFGTGFATFSDDNETLTVHGDTAGTYNVLVMGTRKDRAAVENWHGVERDRI
jgi:hypothetical protein